MNKATEGRPSTNAHGNLTITTTVEHDGIAFRVSDGVHVIDELTKTFTDRGQAAAYYRHLAQAAAEGKRVYQIVWELQALEEAQNAATGRTEDEIAEALNAEVDAHHAETIAVHNQTVTAVAEVMAGTAQTGGWYGARKAAQQAAPRVIEPTRTRVHCKPLTGVELDLIRQHVAGIVTTRPGQSWTVLRAIWRRGYGTPTYRPGTRIIASLQLNARGMALTAQQGIAA